MTKLELKKLIKETILNEMVNTHPVHKSIEDKLMQIANREKDDDEIIGYSYERYPDTPEDQHSLRTRIYHNKKTGKNYIKQIGDGEEDKIFKNEK
jgi:hypothetical protein